MSYLDDIYCHLGRTYVGNIYIGVIFNLDDISNIDDISYLKGIFLIK